MIPLYDLEQEKIIRNFKNRLPDKDTKLDYEINYDDVVLYWKASHQLSENKKYLFPSLLLLAYACEIALKGLLSYKKIFFAKNHNLYDLFIKLPAQDQEQIFTNFRIYFQKKLILQYPQKSGEIEKQLQSLGISTFKSKFQTYDLSVFVKLRYNDHKSNYIVYSLILDSFTNGVKNHFGSLLEFPELK